MHLVHTESSCGWGGQELRVLTESEGMIERGHHVEIWAPPSSNIYIDAQRRGVPCRALPIERKSLAALSAVRAALSASRPDVVNTHSSTDAWLVALASLTLRGAPPMVRTRHISAAVPNNFATRWLYDHATRHIVTTGERLRATLITDNRLRDTRITSIPTGIDTTRFSPSDAREARRCLGLDVAKRYIGIVATLRSWKGHLYLLEAFASLARHDDDLRLLIVGDGPMLDVLKERVAALQIADKVVFAGRQENVPEWLRAFEVFCLPSYANEGVPQSIVQAMLTALPIVTTPVGSIAEAVTDGVTGLLVPPKDVEALAAALRRLLSDAVFARSLGAAARQDAVRRFGIESMLAAMENVFHDVIARHARRRRGLPAHWQRLQRSIGRRLKEAALPRGYMRLGTKYGGWWIDRFALAASPFVIDCGLGRDISFPAQLLARFGGTVIGIDPNPESLQYCREHCPSGMQIMGQAFWVRAGETLTFHLPRTRDQLPMGADGVSGSLLDSHDYVAGGETVAVTTTSLAQVLKQSGRSECDVLKLDIEGAEYDVLEDLCASGALKHVRQLLVEFHHGVTHRQFSETEATVHRVEQSGFRLMHVEGRNYVFRRDDLG